MDLFGRGVFPPAGRGALFFAAAAAPAFLIDLKRVSLSEPHLFDNRIICRFASNVC
jgi:hypothetical protein